MFTGLVGPNNMYSDCLQVLAAAFSNSSHSPPQSILYVVVRTTNSISDRYLLRAYYTCVRYCYTLGGYRNERIDFKNKPAHIQSRRSAQEIALYISIASSHLRPRIPISSRFASRFSGVCSNSLSIILLSAIEI